ncbi:MAG: DNA topoisomerase I, partial [Acetobacteraceae bacterium]|nr:DNA topoisomerase I [Acetobacteraceae bacterium]
SLDRDDDILSVGINRAVDVLARKLANVRTLGPHPKDGEPLTVRKGRFGPYVQHGKTVANLPRGVAMEDVARDEAVALLAEKGKPLKPRGAKGRKPGKLKAVAPPAEKTVTNGTARKPGGKAKGGTKALAKPAKTAAKAPRRKRASPPSRTRAAG